MNYYIDTFTPMLAKLYEDYKDSIEFPCYVQPKLDGMRCIAICTNGDVTLFSRNQKRIETIPHIVEELKSLIPKLGVNWVLDGELYNHMYKNDFNKIMSILKRDELHVDFTTIEYHIYDLPDCKLSTSNRLFLLKSIETDNIKPLKHIVAYNHTQINEAFDAYISDGYEGAMVRTNGLYETKRSKHLLKFKKFQDAEFKITGVTEGKGKLKNCAGSVTCVTNEGKSFNVKMKGDFNSLSDILKNFESKYMGKNLTVKFFNYTPDGIPRFPVGVRVRIDE